MPTYDKKGKGLRGQAKRDKIKQNEERKAEADKPEDTYSVWGSPTRCLDSQWGKLTYYNWCEKERGRLAKKGKFVEIVTAKDGEIALREIGI